MEENQLIGLKALVIDNSKVLLGRRINSVDNGLFEIPGGKPQLGEDLDQALVREVKEETGVEIEPVNVWKDQGDAVAILQRPDKKFILVVFLAKVKNRNQLTKGDGEMNDISFYSKEEVQRFLQEGQVRSVLVDLLERFVKGEFNG